MPTNFDIYHHLSPKLENFLDRHYLSISNKLEHIMSAISDYAVKQNAFNADMSSKIDTIQTAITALNALITTLQNSSGTVSAADQATIDSLVSSGTDLQAKVDAAAALDAPPVPTP